MLITGKTLVVLLRNEDLLTSVIFCTGAFQCNTQGPVFVDHILSLFLIANSEVQILKVQCSQCGHPAPIGIRHQAGILIMNQKTS